MIFLVHLITFKLINLNSNWINYVVISYGQETFYYVLTSAIAVKVLLCFLKDKFYISVVENWSVKYVCQDAWQCILPDVG